MPGDEVYVLGALDIDDNDSEQITPWVPPGRTSMIDRALDQAKAKDSLWVFGNLVGQPGIFLVADGDEKKARRKLFLRARFVSMISLTWTVNSLLLLVLALVGILAPEELKFFTGAKWGRGR